MDDNCAPALGMLSKPFAAFPSANPRTTVSLTSFQNPKGTAALIPPSPRMANQWSSKINKRAPHCEARFCAPTFKTLPLGPGHRQDIASRHATGLRHWSAALLSNGRECQPVLLDQFCRTHHEPKSTDAARLFHRFEVLFLVKTKHPAQNTLGSDAPCHCTLDGLVECFRATAIGHLGWAEGLRNFGWPVIR